MNKFDKWDIAFRDQKLDVFNNNPDGLLWLKVRAICRGRQLKEFLGENNIVLNSTKVSDKNRELFDILINRADASIILDRFLQSMNHEWYNEMGVDIEQLKEDLYNVQYYSWGGDQNNSLDKYFISRYVKIISKYSDLQNRQAEIGANAWNYVQNSWYNNWTSFIIESFFKQNPRIISAVGEIKSVDFFIDEYPIDLKVTFFPNQFMEQKLKGILGTSEKAWLKKKCKTLGISCDPKASEPQQIYTLTEKLKEIGRSDVIRELDAFRNQIIVESQENPTELIKWLYENQGEMRFGAENRIYLILADSADFAQAWKMKRAFSLIEPKIKQYIENFSAGSLKKIEFEFKKRRYSTLSDIIFVVK